MNFFRTLISEYTYILPLLSVLLTMFTLPPYHWPWCIFFSFIFLFTAIKLAQTRGEAMMYGCIFGSFFSSYVTFNVLHGFHWFAGAEIFVWFMYGIGFGIVVIASLLHTLIAYIFFRYRDQRLLTRILVLSILFTAVDTTITVLLSNFDYMSVQFAVITLPGAIWLQSFIRPEALVFVVMVANITIVEFFFTKKKWLLVIPIIIIGVFVTDIQHFLPSSATPDTSIKIALIQSQERDTTVVFGKTVDGVFEAEHLAELIEKAAEGKPDMIVYPFNPWVGAMIEDGAVANFDRDIIAVRESVFTDWVAANVPRDTVFVTWYTAYRDGAFYNEIGYWQNGVLLGAYQKQKLFPFFDYTPTWAQNISLYSTPFDGSAGLFAATPVVYNNIDFGNIICSEVTNNNAVKQSMLGADILFSIGSEAMFTNELPAAFNFLKARAHASAYRTPVVRATKLGPSGVFDAYGRELGSLPYGADGILVVDVPIER